MKKLAIGALGLAAILGATLAVGGAIAGSPADTDILTTIAPYPASITEASWPSASAAVDDRVVAWYQDNKIGALSVPQLEDAVKQLSAALAERPEVIVNELFWFREIVLRREAACRSLPADHEFRKGEYCSETSAPDFKLPE